MDRQRLIRMLVVATALTGLVLPRDLPAQLVQKATYVNEGSFTLPPQGSRAPESPRALALSPVDGSLHVAGRPGRVFVYDSAGTFVRSDGQQQLEDPFAVVVDDEGRSYVLEGESNQVWTFGPEGEVMGAFGGRGDDLERLDDPRDLDVGPSGYVYVLDAGRRGIQIYSRDGGFIRRVSLGEVVGSPWRVAVARDGTIYVADEDAATHVLEYAPFTERTW